MPIQAKNSYGPDFLEKITWADLALMFWLLVKNVKSHIFL
jgi:hypothetical protein